MGSPAARVSPVPSAAQNTHKKAETHQNREPAELKHMAELSQMRRADNPASWKVASELLGSTRLPVWLREIYHSQFPDIFQDTNKNIVSSAKSKVTFGFPSWDSAAIADWELRLREEGMLVDIDGTLHLKDNNDWISAIHAHSKPNLERIQKESTIRTAKTAVHGNGVYAQFYRNQNTSEDT